jgi:hypothetical protein
VEHSLLCNGNATVGHVWPARSRKAATHILHRAGVRLSQRKAGTYEEEGSAPVQGGSGDIGSCPMSEAGVITGAGGGGGAGATIFGFATGFFAI